MQKDVTEARLKPELTKLQHYFDDVLGITPQVAPWPEAVELPVFPGLGDSFISSIVLCSEARGVGGYNLCPVLPRSVVRELHLGRSAGW